MYNVVVEIPKSENAKSKNHGKENNMNNPAETIENNFKYHAPKERQPEKYQILRNEGKSFAKKILDLCPDSRERSIAFTKLEETIMWANASIARN